jgi:hypothetical protein
MKKITKNGSTVTSGATSAVVAVPNNSAGTTARAVLITCPASEFAYVLPGISSTVATTNSIMIANESLCLDVNGCTHIAYIQGSTAAKINIVPLEE